MANFLALKRDRADMGIDPILLKINYHRTAGVRKLARSCIKFAREAK